LDNSVKGVGGKNFAAFKKEFESDYSSIRGQVQEALDRGRIVKITAGGQFHFEWDSHAEANGRICSVPQGKSPNIYLYDYMVNNWVLHAKNIAKANNVSSEVNSGYVDAFEESLKGTDEGEPKVKGPVDFVNEAIGYSMLTYDHRTKTVNYINKKGEIDKKPLIAVPFNGWVEALVKQMESDDAMLKTLKAKINGTKMGLAKNKAKEGEKQEV
jgi:hypothetical protein